MSIAIESVPGHASACANCATPLAGDFCHACGQRAHVHKSLLHLCEEVLHGLLHVDAKAWRTLPMLVAHPGQLTRRYIDGHRTRYVSPLALFLFMVVAMFFVASLTSGGGGQQAAAPTVVLKGQPGLEAKVAAAKTTVANARAALAVAHMQGGDLAAAQAAVDGAVAQQMNLQASLDVVERSAARAGQGRFTGSTGWTAADAVLRHAKENPDLAIYKLKNAGAKYSFLLVPISLPFLWLLFWRRRDVTMYDHAVFSLYSLSFMALLFSLVFILDRVGLDKLALILALGLPPLHMFLQLRGTYALGRWPAVWRTGALMLIAALVFVMYAALVLILSIG